MDKEIMALVQMCALRRLKLKGLTILVQKTIRLCLWLRMARMKKNCKLKKFGLFFF